MAASSTTFSLYCLVAFFTVAVAVAISPTEAPAHERITTKLIKETCEKTQYVELCVDALSSSSKASTADLMTLVEIAVEVAKNKANKTAVHINNLLEKAHFPDQEQCLSDCAESYQDVIDQLIDCEGELDFLTGGAHEAKLEIAQWVDAALSDVTTCQDGCKGHADNGDILTERNDESKRYCTIVKDIVKLVPL